MFAMQWTVLDDAAGVLVYEYEFAPEAFANAFVVRIGDGQLLCVSPPTECPESLQAELQPYGKVVALIAPNSWHHLGLGPWKQAFPEASVYAPAPGLERIRKKQPGLGSVAPVSDLPELPGEVSVLEVPGFSTGETWVTVRTGSGLISYVGDSFMSLAKVPSKLLPRLLFKWFDSAPGFKVNRLGARFFLKDKQAYQQWAAERLAEAPTTVVTGHGATVREEQLGAQMRQMIDAAL